MGTLVAGLDDAGRGSVIGPLVIAGILVTADKVEELRGIGVKDSKLLSPSRRLRLVEEIERNVLKHVFVEATPKEIDEVVLRKKKFLKLNFLEAKIMASIINELKPDVAYVDASDTVADRFGKQVDGMLTCDVKVISEHEADRKYLVVGAASILAKVRRDTVIAGLRKIHGDFGSGYPSDPRTLDFLRRWVKSYGAYPDFVRKSWKTAVRIRTEVSGSPDKLENYFT